MKAASGDIQQAVDARGAAGLDAVVAADGLLSINWHPIGTGPYRLVSEDANGIHLEAWPGYHGGPAATCYLDFVPAKGDGADLVDGSVDIFQAAYLGATFQATAASTGVRVATPPRVSRMGSSHSASCSVRAMISSCSARDKSQK